MYNSHRGIMPTQPANNRLAELLDGVRQEFDAQAGRATEYEQQRKCSIPESSLVYFHFESIMIRLVYLDFEFTW